MTLLPSALSFALLQAMSMLIFQPLMGFSFALSLRHAPSRFVMATVAQYYHRTQIISIVWLLGAAAWIGFTITFGAPHGPHAGAIAALSTLTVLLWVGAVAFQLWAAYVWAPDLTHAVRCTQSQDHGRQIIAVTEEGELLPVIETPVKRTAAMKAPIALVGSGVLLAGATAMIGAALPHLALPVGDEKALFAGFIVALYFSLAMVATNLVHDVWPGTTSPAALQRAFTYYMYLFEQWRNWAIPVFLFGVVILSVYYVVSGILGPLFLGFPVLAIGWPLAYVIENARFHYRGGAAPRLSFPLCKNRYSAEDPLWAHVPTASHVGLALCLIADVVALNVRLFGTSAG
jgi:hypothetical protein